MAQPAVYKARNVITRVGGLILDDILEDGEIRIAYDRPNVTKQIDIHDGGIFSYKTGFPCTVTIPIMQNSRWITILNAYVTAGAMTSLVIRDANDYDSALVIDIKHCMLQTADVVFGSEATAREYVFEAIQSTTLSAS